MKAEKDHSKKDKKSGGFSAIATAFAAGAATGLAIGAFISSEKGAGFRDKIKNFIREADGSFGEKQENQSS